MRVTDYRVLRETLELYERGYPHTDAARDALRMTENNPQRESDPEPLTDEQVAAEMWRLTIETPWDRAHPEIQHLMTQQVASVRRALASLVTKKERKAP